MEEALRAGVVTDPGVTPGKNRIQNSVDWKKVNSQRG